LKKITDSVSPGWSGSQGVRDYLKSVNDRINSGQADQVVQESLKTLSQQANEKKVEVMSSVVDFMKAKGISWDRIQQVVGQWTSQILKMNPADLFKNLKF